MSYGHVYKERFVYRIHYGWIDIASAVILTEKTPYTIHEKSCCKVDILAETKGIVKMINQVKNHWGAYLDIKFYQPCQFYRYIQEGKYRKNEIVYFDHKHRKIIVKNLDKHDKNKIVDVQQYPMQAQEMHGIISASWKLRQLDYTALKVNERIIFNIFFDHETSIFQAKFLGKENLKTKIGIYPTYVFAPVIPQNKVFRKKNPIKIWISDDAERIPLKIQANLKIGGIKIDIKEKYVNSIQSS